MHGGDAVVMLVMLAGGFATIFGIYYLRTRQNMAMIDKGMNPRESFNRPAPYKNLKWALLLLGSGVGLFLAYILDVHVLHPLVREVNGDGRVYYTRHNNDSSPAIYFSLIAIGGGIGLLVSYYMEKKWWDQNKGNL